MPFLHLGEVKFKIRLLSVDMERPINWPTDDVFEYVVTLKGALV